MNPIEISDLTVNFGSFRALDGLTFHVKPETIHGFLGPNGAGKSTTIRTLLGLLHPHSGSVRVLGEDPVSKPEVLKRVGYVPGDVSLWPQLTGAETLRALEKLRGIATDRTREHELIDAFGLDTAKRCRDYSTGNRRKVLLVAALSTQAELFIMDEPTAGLDPLMERVFVDEVRKEQARGATILLSSHILSEVEQLCHSVTVIKAGRAVANGEIDTLRNLAGYRLAASLPSGERIEKELNRDQVNEELQRLLGEGAHDISVAPASLEETFVQQYSGTASTIGGNQ